MIERVRTNPHQRLITVTMAFVMVSTAILNVAAMDVGTDTPVRSDHGIELDVKDLDLTGPRSVTSRADVPVPNETLFQDPPLENRILPIYNGQIDMATLDHFEDLGVGGLVVNSWQWNKTTLQAAKDKDWTMWVNDYYMYPSGNANPFGGVHETLWNPSFEKDRLGLWPEGWVWSWFDWPIVDKTGAEAHSGQIAVAADDFNFFIWGLGVDEGDEYNISVWAKGDTGTETGRVIILWYDIDTMISSNVTIFQTSSNYTRYWINARAPPGANVAKILIQGHETGKFVWFDDVMVRKNDPSVTNILANPGFEQDTTPMDGVPDAWIPQNAPTYDTTGTESHSGNAAVLVNATSTFLQPAPGVPGKEYHLGIWARSAGAPLLGQVVMLFLNQTWSIVGISGSIMIVNETYMYYDILDTAPPDTAFVLPAMASATDAYVWIDDATLTEPVPLNDGVSRGPVLEGHPELEAQGLYYASQDVTSLQTSNLTLPHGALVLAVAAPIGGGDVLDLGQAVDLAGSIVDRKVVWSPPNGNWRVMAFTVDILYNGTEVDPALSNMHQINVMNKVAVQGFIDEMYKKTLYDGDGASEHFGDMIVASFTDEVSNLAAYFLSGQEYPVVAWLQDDVNGLYLEDTFDELHGYDLIPVLPALWNDVGDKTAKHRVAFYNTTAYLQGEAYYRMIGEWCADHGINFSGHLLSEESLIHHTAFYGDYFESIKHMGYPGIDTLRQNAGDHDEMVITPKLASSASLLYGKPHTMTEYSIAANSMNYRNMTAVINWEAAQGIDVVTSFAFWRGVMPDNDLRRHSEHVGRVNYMLQQGDYTTDIAVLYPITTFQAEYVPRTDTLWDRGKFGGFEHDESFKDLAGALLSAQMDFIFINDESLRIATLENGTGEAVLHHDVSGLDLKVLFIPEMYTIRTETMEKVRDFYEAGGVVVALGHLPYKSAENGTDPYIDQLVEEVFDTGAPGPGGYTKRTNANGGVGIKGTGDPYELELPVLDALEPDLIIEGAADDILYMKRTAPGFDIYFLVNNAPFDIMTDIAFKTFGDPSLWDPENGQTTSVSGSMYHYDAGEGYSVMTDLRIGGFSSVFVVFKRPIVSIAPEDIMFDPEVPVVGDEVIISFNVSNLGHGVAPQVKVKAFDDEVQIGTTMTVTIADHGVENMEVIWDTTDSPGLRNVTIEACLPDGSCASALGHVHVNTPPVAVIEVDRQEAMTFETFNLTSNSTDIDGPLANWSWDLGDGNTSEGPEVVHSYADDGDHIVTLTVTDLNGTTNATSVKVTVLNRAPVADLRVSPSTTGDATTTFALNASGSTDRDGSIVNLSWDLGDGGTAFGIEVEHTYATPGNYTVNLTVEDDDGAKAHATIDIDLVNLAPVASFTVTPGTGNVTTTFEFGANASDLDGTIEGYNWSFGDGTSRNASSPEHTYSDDGTYIVTLEVVDDRGMWSLRSSGRAVVENLGPVARVSPSVLTIKEGEYANLSAAGSTDPDDDISELAFEWDMDDGASGPSGVNVSHVYDEAGVYNVTLTVTDDDGASSELTVVVTVEEVKDPGPKPEDPGSVLCGVIALIVVIVTVVAVILIVMMLRKGRKAGPEDAKEEGPPEEEEEKVEKEEEVSDDDKEGSEDRAEGDGEEDGEVELLEGEAEALDEEGGPGPETGGGSTAEGELVPEDLERRGPDG